VRYPSVRMRASLIVIVDPVPDLGPGVIEAEEQALVEKLVAHAHVKTLAEAILHWLSGSVRNFVCGGHNGNEGDLPWPDAKSLR
jgi:hypothetical protein